MIRYIADTAHYNGVLSRVVRIRHSLWIGAADHFDSVWTGAHCPSCLRKSYCPDRIR